MGTMFLNSKNFKASITEGRRSSIIIDPHRLLLNFSDKRN